jgi:hypothetical protein
MFAVPVGNVKQFYPNHPGNFVSEAIAHIKAEQIADETVKGPNSSAPSLLLMGLAGTKQRNLL